MSLTCEHKDVVVIGNGPSAITLSFILAGNWPYYNPEQRHPDDSLHARIMSQLTCSINPVSLLEMNLEFISQGLTGRSINPLSLLLDTLQHPEADFGADHPSCLTWVHHPNKRIDHVILGQGQPGGCWNRMTETEVLTVSFANWMSLPSWEIVSSSTLDQAESLESVQSDLNPSSISDLDDEEEEEEEEEEDHNRNSNLSSRFIISPKVRTISSSSTSGRERISLGDVSNYYKEYVKHHSLQQFFRNDTQVTGLHFDEKTSYWKVNGWQEGRGKFTFTTPRVVLATGASDLGNRLNIPGEDLPFVSHSIQDLDLILKEHRRCPKSDPILIVGSGLTAADALLHCEQYRIPVKHIFRRHPDDPALVFNQLPSTLYPEYHRVHHAMKGSNPPALRSPYSTFAMHSVAEIRKNKEVTLTNLMTSGDGTLTTKCTVKVSHVLVLIGRRADLSFIRSPQVRHELPMFPGEPIHPRNNPVQVNPFTHEVDRVTGLYAMGPLVGDNFVRFVQGAALAITHSIWNNESTLHPLT